MRRLLPALLLAALSAACATTPEPTDGPAEAKEATIDEMNVERRGDETVKEYDLNRDKKPDVWKFFVGGESEQLVRKELDVNWDGKVDVRYFYGDAGQLEREALDLDFDGRVDAVNFYEKGQKNRAELDLDFDNRTDLWKFFQKGKLVRKERDTNADGKVDTWEYYEGDALDRIGEDTDGDGQVDRWTKKSDS